jgi:hypothetical protein
LGQGNARSNSWEGLFVLPVAGLFAKLKNKHMRLKELKEQHAEKENELIKLRIKIRKGEIGGMGVPDLIKQVEDELQDIKDRIFAIEGRRVSE